MTRIGERRSRAWTASAHTKQAAGLEGTAEGVDFRENIGCEHCEHAANMVDVHEFLKRYGGMMWCEQGEHISFKGLRSARGFAWGEA
jgi:hypothetical protein